MKNPYLTDRWRNHTIVVVAAGTPDHPGLEALYWESGERMRSHLKFYGETPGEIRVCKWENTSCLRGAVDPEVHAFLKTVRRYVYTYNDLQMHETEVLARYSEVYAHLRNAKEIGIL